MRSGALGNTAGQACYHGHMLTGMIARRAVRGRRTRRVKVTTWGSADWNRRRNAERAAERRSERAARAGAELAAAEAALSPMARLRYLVETGQF
jgi:hypothetical protein